MVVSWSLVLMLLVNLSVGLGLAVLVVLVVPVVLVAPRAENFVPLLVHVAFLRQLGIFNLYLLEFDLKVPVGGLEVVTLLQPLASAVLRVSAVFQGPSLLLQSHDL